jgi:hypothetical protein
MQRKYKQLVPQGVSSLTVPLECRQEMIGVTLTQWCVEERLDLTFGDRCLSSVCRQK